jgi:hypothetical protein
MRFELGFASKNTSTFPVILNFRLYIFNYVFFTSSNNKMVIFPSFAKNTIGILNI